MCPLEIPAPQPARLPESEIFGHELCELRDLAVQLSERTQQQLAPICRVLAPAVAPPCPQFDAPYFAAQAKNVSEIAKSLVLIRLTLDALEF